MISLHILSIVLGAILVFTSLPIFFKTESTMNFLEKFPRSLPIGYFFLVLSTFWFLYYFNAEEIVDFAPVKKYMFVGFIVLAVGVGLFVKDFLAVRAYSIFLFLVAKLICDTARYADSSWAFLYPLFAMILVCFGICFTAAPYKMRDLLSWLIASSRRLKVLATARITLGVIFLILGFSKIQ